MNEKNKYQRVVFTLEEIRAFKVHALIVAVSALGLYLVASKGLGQVLGVLFAVALLPVPPMVIYFVRRSRGQR